MTQSDSKRFLLFLFLLGLAITLLVVIADATTLALLKFDELVAQASAIARVHCLRTESHWHNQEIWTRSEFLVTETSKGSLPRVVQVEMPGGVVGALHSQVDEVPAFFAGEDAYIFLWQSPSGDFRILGWSQGAFRIHKDPVTALETVTQDSAGAPLFDPVGRQFRRNGIRDLPLVAFQLKLQRALRK